MDTNNITGDRLVGKGNNTEEYQSSWERTFGSKSEKKRVETQLEIPFIWDTSMGATNVDCCGHCGLDSKDGA